MIQVLRKLAIIFGVVSIILPIVIVSLWYKYVREQESLYQNSKESRKPCEPFSFTTSHTQEKLNMKWETKEACSGFILLGTTYTDFSNLPYKVLSDQGETPATGHQVTLLKQDELKYRYAIVVSDGDWYGLRGNPFEYK